jgi:hypothetical protein
VSTGKIRSYTATIANKACPHAHTKIIPRSLVETGCLAAVLSITTELFLAVALVRKWWPRRRQRIKAHP